MVDGARLSNGKFFPIKQTNADKIRQMTDEELVNLLLKFDVCGQIQIRECESHRCNCESCVLDWLKQEVSDD